MTLRDDEHDPDEAIDFLTWAYPSAPGRSRRSRSSSARRGRRRFGPRPRASSARSSPSTTSATCTGAATFRSATSRRRPRRRRSRPRTSCTSTSIRAAARTSRASASGSSRASRRRPNTIPRPSCVVFSGRLQRLLATRGALDHRRRSRQGRGARELQPAARARVRRRQLPQRRSDPAPPRLGELPAREEAGEGAAHRARAGGDVTSVSRTVAVVLKVAVP